MMVVTARHAEVLAWLQTHPDTSVDGIALALSENREAVVALCGKLAAEGLVEVVANGTA